MQVPPPPIVVARPPAQQFVSWQVGAAACGGSPARYEREPVPATAIGFGAPGRTESVRYSFTIDPSGRVLDIKRDGTAWVAFADDLGPALATARFAPIARTACSVVFTSRLRPIDEVPGAELFAHAALASAPLPAALRTRLDAASGDCGRPYPVLRLRTYPDLKALPRLPGAPSWTVTRFAIDRHGRPTDIVTAQGSGNAALDEAAVAALRRSQFEPGERHGCLWPLRLAGATLAPPEPPREDALRPAGATCPRSLPYDKQPTLTFPQAWQRRSIEGWAVVAYDVAPWGAIGNARVLAAEPAAEFGDWALNVVRFATKRTSGSGYTGCVDRVRFRIGDEARVVTSSENLPRVD